MKKGPSALGSFLWRVGVGTPRTRVVWEHVGRVAADLEAHEVAARAARVLGLPGLYRSPSAWGGDAIQPSESAFPRREWVARCQAASFEIAVPLGRAAVPFVEENAFGPFAALHGTALRSLLRLAANGEVDPSTLDAALDRIAELEPDASEEALDGLSRLDPRTAAKRLNRRLRRSFVEGLDRVAGRARSVGQRLATLDPLSRLDPDRARRFLPDLQGLMTRGGEHALAAAVLVRTLDPRDPKAREALRRFANEHPDPRVRETLETHLRPPRPVPGGRA
ncbi:MAG: hypothetical protein AAFZ18_16780 [Myxococcota bacterium]